MIRWVLTSLRLGFRNWLQLLGLAGGFLVPWLISGHSIFSQSNDPSQTIYGAILVFCFGMLFNTAYLVVRPMFRLGTQLTPSLDLLQKWRPVANQLGLNLSQVAVVDGSAVRGMVMTGWTQLTLQVSRELLTEVPDSDMEVRAACCLSERIPAATTPLVSHLVRYGAAIVLLAAACRFVPAYLLLVPGLALAAAFYRGWMKRAKESVQIRTHALEGISVSPEDFARVISTSYQSVAQSGALGPFTRTSTAEVNNVVVDLGHPQHAIPVERPRVGRYILIAAGILFGLLVLSVAVAMTLPAAG